MECAGRPRAVRGGLPMWHKGAPAAGGFISMLIAACGGRPVDLEESDGGRSDSGTTSGSGGKAGATGSTGTSGTTGTTSGSGGTGGSTGGTGGSTGGTGGTGGSTGGVAGTGGTTPDGGP